MNWMLSVDHCSSMTNSYLHHRNDTNLLLIFLLLQLQTHDQDLLLKPIRRSFPFEQATHHLFSSMFLPHHYFSKWSNRVPRFLLSMDNDDAAMWLHKVHVDFLYPYLS